MIEDTTARGLAPEQFPAHRRERNPDYKAIEKLKAEILIEQVAAEYGEFKLLGNERLLGRCVSPFHTDKTASMTVFTDTQRFKCFGIGCGIGGDVIDLEEYAGKHADTWTAVVALSTRYDVELPGRPRRWHRRQDEKARDHAHLRRTVAARYQRRLFRVFGLYLEDIEDPNERREEGRLFFEDLRPLAESMAIRFLQRRGTA